MQATSIHPSIHPWSRNISPGWAKHFLMSGKGGKMWNYKKHTFILTSSQPANFKANFFCHVKVFCFVFLQMKPVRSLCSKAASFSISISSSNSLQTTQVTQIIAFTVHSRGWFKKQEKQGGKKAWIWPVSTSLEMSPGFSSLFCVFHLSYKHRPPKFCSHVA